MYSFSIAPPSDAPSAATGTGTALVADGQDTALVRCSVVDARGVVVPDGRQFPTRPAVNVTFEVVSGQGAARHDSSAEDLSRSNVVL